MNYTFKLSRRMAAARFAPLAALLFGTACDTVDSMGAADSVPGDLSLSPAHATAEPRQRIRLAFRDQVVGDMTSSHDVEWTVVGGGGVIAPDGSFTATQPGVYTIIGSKGKGNGGGNNGQGKGNGGPNTDTSTVVVVPPVATLLAIELSPHSASVEVGGHLQFDAVGRDANGATVAIGVEWEATGGTIDAGGHYIAGSTGGHFRVIASHGATGLADTASIEVVAAAPTPEPAPAPAPAPPSASYPHQPAGHVRIAEHHWPAFPNSTNATLGEWNDIVSSNYSVVSASTPTGDGRAMQVRFPKGLSAGVSPGKFRFWREMTVSSAIRLQEMYVSTWIRILGSDFENQATATKLFYWAYGNAYNLNDAAIYLRNGTGSQAIMSAMELQLAVSPGDNRDPEDAVAPNYYQNLGSSKKFTVGDWHRIELLVNVGTPDRADGSVKVWLDGELVMDHRSVKHLDSDYDFTDGIFQAEWAPVWGGAGGTRTRDDFMQVDGFYVSGLAQ